MMLGEEKNAVIEQLVHDVSFQMKEDKDYDNITILEMGSHVGDGTLAIL